MGKWKRCQTLLAPGFRVASRGRTNIKADTQGGSVATPERRGRTVGGISTGGIIVIVGVILMIIWSFWLGLIITLIGLIAFGGFVRGRWY